MKYIKLTLLLSLFLSIFVNCGKKECEVVSEITPCIEGLFPTEGTSLSMKKTDDSTLVFEFDQIISSEGLVYGGQESNRDDCFIHIIQSNSLVSTDGNFTIDFHFPYASFGRAFTINVVHEVDSMNQAFSLQLLEECNALDNVLDELLGEAFFETITINNHEYQKVYKLARDFITADDIDIDDGQLVYLYYSFEEGIIKFESLNETWEKIR